MIPQFGSLLDENAGAKFDNIGLNAMANNDKAGGRGQVTSSHRANHEDEVIFNKYLTCWTPVHTHIHTSTHTLQSFESSIYFSSALSEKPDQTGSVWT